MHRTFVNGTRVTRVTLKLGDQLSLGSVKIIVADKATAICRMAEEETERTSASVQVPSEVQPAKTKELDGKLSPAQQRVFVLLLQGLRIKHVATKLRRGDATVRNHCKAIYRSLGVRSRPNCLPSACPRTVPKAETVRR